jgi:hypothetical protein
MKGGTDMIIHERTKTRSTETVTVKSNLIELVDAVNASISPGEEELVPYIVSHLIATYKATPGNA